MRFNIGKSTYTDHLSIWKDVHSFPDHIACDGDSRSEIVVPIRVGEKVTSRARAWQYLFAIPRRIVLPYFEKRKKGWADKEQVVAVIDIDSTVTSAFDDEDRTALETLANILGAACDW